MGEFEIFDPEDYEMCSDYFVVIPLEKFPSYESSELIDIRTDAQYFCGVVISKKSVLTNDDYEGCIILYRNQSGQRLNVESPIARILESKGLHPVNYIRILKQCDILAKVGKISELSEGE